MMEKLLHFDGQDSRTGSVFTQIVRPGRSGLEKMANGGSLHPEVQHFIRDMDAKPGHTYVLNNALGSWETYGSNINGDTFPEEGLLNGHTGLQDFALDDVAGRRNYAARISYGYPTFYTAHIFQHHANKNPEKTLGVICLVVWNPVMHRVEVIFDLDHELCAAQGATGLIERINTGDFPATSMGCKVPDDRCNICGNRAKTRHDYCVHVSNKDPRFRMNMILPDGRKCCVHNDKPRFFDDSFVTIGADKTAYVMAKVASAGQKYWLFTKEGAALPSALRGELYYVDEPTEKVAGLQTLRLPELVEQVTVGAETRKARAVGLRKRLAQKEAGILPEFLTKTRRDGFLDPRSDDFSKNQAFGRSVVPAIGGGAIGGGTAALLSELRPAKTLLRGAGRLGAGVAAGTALAGTVKYRSQLKKFRAMQEQGLNPVSGTSHAEMQPQYDKAKAQAAVWRSKRDAREKKAGFGIPALSPNRLTPKGVALLQQHAGPPPWDELDAVEAVMAWETENQKEWGPAQEQAYAIKTAAIHPDDYHHVAATLPVLPWELDSREKALRNTELGIANWKKPKQTGMFPLFNKEEYRKSEMEAWERTRDPAYRKELAHELVGDMELDKEASIDDEMFELRVKKAGQKLGEMLKQLPPGPSSVLKRLEQLEKPLPTSALDALAGAPDLSTALAAPTRAAIVLRPEEYQRVCLTHAGHGQMARSLWDRGVTFDPLMGRATGMSPGAGMNPLEEILHLIRPLLDSARHRSCCTPVFQRRITMMFIESPPDPLFHDTSSGVMLKLADGYADYRQSVRNSFSDIIEGLEHPLIKEAVLRNEILDLRAGLKTASPLAAIPLAALAILGPLIYLNSAHWKSQKEMGEDLGLIKSVIADHPALATALAVGAGAAATLAPAQIEAAIRALA